MKTILSIFILLLTFIFSTSSYSAGSIKKQGRLKSTLCAGCHGQNGIGISNEFPNLAAQNSVYLQKQLYDFKSGKRNNATMNAMAQNLTNNDIKILATYFSSLPRQSSAISANNINNNQPQKNNASIIEFPEIVFSSMKGGGTIEKFPSEIVANGAKNMLYTALTPNGKMLLSTSPSTNSVYVFNTTTLQQLAVIKVGKAPKGVKVMPDGKFAYVSNQGSNNISIIDLNALKNIGSIKTAAGPHNVRFTKNGKLAYVTLQGGAGLGVINTKKEKMIHIIPVTGITGPHNLDLSKDEKFAYLRDFINHVAIIDLKTEKVIKVITVGKGHGGIDVFPNGNFVATAAIGDTFISVINTKTLTINNIELGSASHGIRASKNNQWLYVTLPKENTIAVINTNNWQVEKKIAVGKFPFWLAVQGNP